MSSETVVKPAGPIDRNSIVDRAREINSRLTKVSPQCEAIAVIPVYREFEGGRIMNLLEELQCQNVGSRRFETILVVNNPSFSDLSMHTGSLDNLKFLTHINAQKQAGNFSNVHVLDCSRGEIPTKHMGLVRGFGQLVAEQRLDRTLQGDSGVIIQLDADVSIDSDFVTKLLEAYQNPWVDSAMIGRIPLPIDFKSDDYYLTYATQFAEAVESCLNRFANFNGDGPTLSLRASRHKEYNVRQYIHHATSEDFELGKALSDTDHLFLVSEPRVFKGDRIRPDGFDSKLREYWVKTGPSWDTAKTLIDHAHRGLSVTLGQFGSMPRSDFWKMVSAELDGADPEAAVRLKAYLAREEKLGRRAMSWDNLNPQLKDQALYLYAFSRLAMGEEQLLSLPAQPSRGYRLCPDKIITLENKPPKEYIYQTLREHSFSPD